MEHATQEKIRTRGLRALLRELGPVDTARFLRQFDPGKGDYTQERHAWLDGLAVDQVVQGVEEARSKQ
ncbi:MAG: hypothetical protein ABIZ49_08315 [Opitutaceae bacterium]